ncbi:tetrapyrrole methylase family protein / MazG family protein [Selenomonas ruminantium]|uniref:Tetrapyrrole methylase family protein / MazG family protein n=1 Tax=Selenomonas ruminantium TaxID=971 RepID=A0A1M6R3C6_SELRU|nr:SAM-dependent methyltransferase [Selenomonas ruminantium]SHK26979.1 tetrapyrrole methylase family protein / MazG family protein [Selenomonas ruminantium]
MAKITVVGLGPGHAGLITRESWALMEQAEHLILRTKIHPTVAALDEAGIQYTTYDGFYEEAADFETLYRSIAADLLKKAEAWGELVYVVPGSPLVAERTVVLLRDMAKGTDVAVDIRPGMSFVEVMYTRLGIDPVEGLTILDALDIETLNETPAQSLIITQVYSQPIASDAKLMLMELYPDEYEITYIHDLAMEDESIRQIPLYELDRQPDLDHLTSLYIRPVQANKAE